MAKQRPQPKSQPQENDAPSRSAAPPPRSPSADGAAASASQTSQGSSTPRRSTYVDAVALYEKGLAALQRHDYEAAIGLLQSVLTSYPEEKELQERVRLYLNVCQRQAAARQAAPTTIAERLFAATLAINGGRYDEALKHLRLVRDEDADNDHALYMLAVAHTQRGEFAEAVAHLERAVAINPENRALARHDADLEPLRDDDAFRAALESPSSAHLLDRRRPFKGKSGQ
jgi:tetratricopeptide (TPR) repeat protein